MSKNKRAFIIKPLPLTIAMVLAGPTVYAYQQGESETVTIVEGEVVSKIDHVTTKNKKNIVSGELNRSGNPARIIWYGNPQDQDSKIAQTGADNKGIIQGKVTAEGILTNNKNQNGSSINIEGQANGIDALGWSAPHNPNSVEIALKTIKNIGKVSGEAELKGALAAVHGKVSSFGSANGISIVGTADFGKDTAIDGFSGATSRSSSSSGGSASVNSSEADIDDEDLLSALLGKESPQTSPVNTEKTDMYGKDLSIAVESVQNSGELQGKLTEQGFQKIKKPFNDKYTPQFYGATSTAGGNGVSLATFIDTPDKYTYSEDKKNSATLKSLDNSGSIKGEAILEGGKNVTHTNTKSIATANGISVYAGTGRYAKNSTFAKVNSVTNSGNISGELQQISGNNSGYDSVHLYSNAESISSGNGISIHTDTRNQRTKKIETELGSLTNTGKIIGNAFVKSGNGAGVLNVDIKASGNGISIHQTRFSDTAKIGDIDNKGSIKGNLETHAGVVFSSANANSKIPDEEVKLMVTTKANRRYSMNPKPEKPKEAAASNGYSTFSPFSADTTVKASGNGISGLSGDGLGDPNKGTALSNINNQGVISGYAKMYHGFAKEYASVDFLGAGVGISTDRQLGWTDNGQKKGNIINSGIISGNYAAVLVPGNINSAYSFSDPTFESGYKADKFENYGIMAGALIAANYPHSAGATSSSEQRYKYFEADTDPLKNYGLKIYLKQGITLDSNNSSFYNSKVIRENDYEKIDRIVVGNGGTYTANGKSYTVENASLDENKKDSSKELSGNINDKIINGIGITSGALVTKNATQLNNSIINGYRTALNIQTTDQVTATNTTFNANGFKVNRTLDPYAVLGNDSNNKFTLTGSSYVNGNINLKAGDDTLTIESSKVKFNGEQIDMAEGNDNVTFGQLDQTHTVSTNNDTPIRVDYAILNAENVKVNALTELTNQAKLTGVTDLALNSNLLYQADSDKAHALYNPNQTSKLNINGTGDFILKIANDVSEINFGNLGMEHNGTGTFKTTNILREVTADNNKLIISRKKTPEELAQEKKEAEEKAAIAKAEKEKAEQELTKQSLLAEQARQEQLTQEKTEAERQAQLKRAEEASKQALIAQQKAEKAQQIAEQKAAETQRNLQLLDQKVKDQQLALQTAESNAQQARETTLTQVEEARKQVELAKQQAQQAQKLAAQNAEETNKLVKESQAIKTQLDADQQQITAKTKEADEKLKKAEAERQAQLRQAEEASKQALIAQQKAEKAQQIAEQKAAEAQQNLQLLNQKVKDQQLALQTAESNAQQARETTLTQVEEARKQVELAKQQVQQAQKLAAQNAEESNKLAKESQAIKTQLDADQQQMIAKIKEADEKLKKAEKECDLIESLLANAKTDPQFEENNAILGKNSVNFLQNSADLSNKKQNLLTADGLAKAEIAAKQAINAYVEQAKNHNLYSAVAPTTLRNLSAYQALSLDTSLPQQKDKTEVKANVISEQGNYKEVANKDRLYGVIMNVQRSMSDTTAIGGNFATSKVRIEGHNENKLKGHSYYSNLYLQKVFGKLVSHIGTQYSASHLDGTREISNSYDTHRFDATTKTRTVGVYAQVKYPLELTPMWRIEPKISVGYNHLKQNAINEKGKASLSINAQKMNIVNASIGQDLISTMPTSNGKVDLKLSTDYQINSGQKDLVAHFANGKAFNIQTEKDKYAFNVGVNLSYLLNNGLSFNAGVANSFRKSGNAPSTNIGVNYQF